MAENGTPDNHTAIDPIDDAAQDWFLHLTSGDVSAADRARYLAWREADPRHAQAYDELAALWTDLADAEPAFAAPEPTPIHGKPSQTPPRRTRAAWLGIAACLALAVVILPTLRVTFTADHITAAGEQQQITLPDGSLAWLNTDTAIALHYTPERREVQLLRGEAQFEIITDASRPFSVLAGDGRATALGTVFGVRLRDDATVVTVSEGRVAVQARHAAVSSASEAHTQLTSDQAAQIHPGGDIGPIVAAERRETAWRNGFIAIDTLPLQDALAELDRYRPGRIVLLAQDAKAVPVTARVAIKHLDDGLGALAATQGLEITRVSDYLVLIH